MTFFSFRKLDSERIGAHALCMQHSPTAAALSTSFLLNHAPPPCNSAELNALTTRFRDQREYESSVKKTEKIKERLVMAAL